MSRKFTLIKDYYEEEVYIYKRKAIEIKPGVTVLIGCNGIGKTTLLHQIKDSLKRDKIPCILFDNLHDGGDRSIQDAFFYDDITFGATAMCSSEGENIVMNIGKLATRLGKFVKNGKDTKVNPFESILKSELRLDSERNEVKIPNERWILLDAIDSGLSVDNVVDIKEHLFKTILEHNFGNEIYIVVSANEYEMARGEQCFDVYNGKYMQIKDYEDYRDFILQSKKWKEGRSK